MWVKATGKFLVTDRTIRIVLDADICCYYKWLFDRAHYFTYKTQTPRYGAHINVVSDKLHNVNCAKYKHLNGVPIQFEYNITGNYGGFAKGFVNFWLDVKCKMCEDIAKDLNTYKVAEGFAPFHLTILNTKAASRA